MSTQPKTPHANLTSDEMTNRLVKALFGDQARSTARTFKARRKLVDEQRPPYSKRNFESALRTATERAAVSGSFEPETIVKGFAKSIAEGVLSRVAPECDVDIRHDNRLWVLGRDKRRSTIARLFETGGKSRLLSVLRGVRSADWDHTGGYLQSILREGGPPAVPGSLPRMRALAQACDWVSGIVDVSSAEQRLRQAIAFRTMIEDRRKLFKNGLYGRQDELDRFEKFMARPLSGPGATPPVLMVSGIGGAGKSTFLAKVTSDLLQRRLAGAPVVIAIDFDRFGLGPSSLIELTFEVTRHLSLYDTAMADPLTAIRRKVRAAVAKDLGSESNISYRNEVSIRWLGDLMRQIGVVIESGGWRDRDILVVLDTFEELQAKRVNVGSTSSAGVDASDQIAAWISQLAGAADLARLRVLVSGRAPISQASQLHRHVVDSLELRDLQPPDAIKVLTGEGLAPDAARRLQPLIGGNPLLLKIAARLIRRLPRKERMSVLKDMTRHKGRFDKELVQGVLYDRILHHIREPRSRKLAHPGLVLRRVTPQLITEVLAGPCGLGTVAETEAKELCLALENEVWLVERDPRRADALVHRPDVRRLMLRLMTRDEVRPESEGADGKGADVGAPSGAAVARMIHEGAAAYYAEQRDRNDSGSVARAEAFYHRMMLVEDKAASSVTQEEVQNIASSFAGDIELLTPALRLRVRRFKGEPLSPEDAALLPEEDWLSYVYAEARSRLDEQQDPLGALELVGIRALGQPGEAAEWQLRAIDAAASWQELDGTWLESASQPRVSPKEVSETWTSFTNAKSLLLMRRGQYAAAIVACNGVLIEMAQPIRGMAKQQGVLAEHLRAANYAIMAQAALERTERPVRLSVAPVAWPFDELPAELDNPSLDRELRRHAALTWQAGTRIPLKIAFSARAFVPDPSWLQRLAKSTGRSDISSVLSVLNEDSTTADILGQVAGEFGKRMRPDRGPGPALPLHFDSLLLCGDSPEMRQAASFALRQAFSGQRDLRRLAEASIRHLPIVPRDLRADEFSRSEQSPAHLISKLVEYADRSLILPKILAAASKLKRSNSTLREVSASTARWQETFQTAVLDRRRKLPAGKETDRAASPSEWPGLPHAVRVTEPARPAKKDLTDRLGYDAALLSIEFPMPVPRSDAGTMVLLPYCRFSVLTSRKPACPVLAAANVTGRETWGVERSIDLSDIEVQLADPRLSRDSQPVVARGRSFAFLIPPHVVSYGRPSEALAAIGDTRYAPNHVPLAVRDPKSEKLWADLDRRLILSSSGEKKSVLFSGADLRLKLRWKIYATAGRKSGFITLAFIMRPGAKNDTAVIHQIDPAELGKIVGIDFGQLGQGSHFTRGQMLISETSDIDDPSGR